MDKLILEGKLSNLLEKQSKTNNIEKIKTIQKEIEKIEIQLTQYT